MGYRSQIALKTTTEGWILLKQFNDKIENPDEKPLNYLTVSKTPTGYYKISHDYIKWYDEDPQVENFNRVLDQYEDQDIPYSFIRIGEDVGDIVHRRNYTDDMPSEIETFEPVVEMNDDDWKIYEEIISEGEEVTTT